MADIGILAPFILSWEGGFSDHPSDRGGATNMGVTIATWRSVGSDKDGDGDIDTADLRLLTKEEAVARVMKPRYWDRWQGDKIASQSVANLVVDWVWGSGKHGITKVQELLGVKADGVAGPVTLAALNSADPRGLFARVHEARAGFLRRAASRPGQGVFLKGWLRRLDAIQYGRLTYNTRPPKVCKFRDI